MKQDAHREMSLYDCISLYVCICVQNCIPIYYILTVSHTPLSFWGYMETLCNHIVLCDALCCICAKITAAGDDT